MSARIECPGRECTLRQRAFHEVPLPAGERGTILVAESHESVRMVVKEILLSRGYHVLPCQDGLEALYLIINYSGPVHLLLTDIVLPIIDGRQLSERGVAIRASLKTLYMSGYPQTFRGNLGIDVTLPYLQKPFTPDELTEKIEDTLSPEFLCPEQRVRLRNEARQPLSKE